LLTLQAGLALWQGRHADARHAVHRGLTETQSDDVCLLATLAWHGLRAEAEAHTSRTVAVDPAAVRRLREVVTRVARSSMTAVGPVRDAVAGYQALCDAEVSRLEDRGDPDVWARAAAVWDRRTHPYPAAYARLRQAEVLFGQRSRNATATAVLRRAFEMAQRLGARPLIAEIETVAARARVSLESQHSGAGMRVARAAPGTDGDEFTSLTAREREVLAAVAEGLTNREIGRRLFISERTIGVHVSHIFEKLQVHSRVQASRIFLRSRHQPSGAS
jgi:DNA-binding CsgD family transcriptional regulator